VFFSFDFSLSGPMDSEILIFVSSDCLSSGEVFSQSFPSSFGVYFFSPFFFDSFFSISGSFDFSPFLLDFSVDEAESLRLFMRHPFCLRFAPAMTGRIDLKIPSLSFSFDNSCLSSFFSRCYFFP